MTDTTAPRTAAAAKGDVIERGIVPCRTCRRPHDYRMVTSQRATWRDPRNGHTYIRMTAEEVIEYLRAEAIEPLLALVRAAQELRAAQNAETDSAARDADRIWDAVHAIYARLDELPAHIRAAARKP